MPISEANPLPTLKSEQFARINVDEYMQMTQTGALVEGSPIELLDGVLVWKDRRDREGSIMVVGIRHTNTLERLYRLLDRATEGHGCFARSQQPIRLSNLSMPEPDVMIVRGDRDDFPDRHPNAAEMVLVVEIADSSLKQDQNDKLKKYAAAGIVEYWVVNLVEDTIEIYRQPQIAAEKYDSVRVLSKKDAVAVTLTDGTEIEFNVTQIIR